MSQKSQSQKTGTEAKDNTNNTHPGFWKIGRANNAAIFLRLSFKIKILVLGGARRGKALGHQQIVLFSFLLSSQKNHTFLIIR